MDTTLKRQSYDRRLFSDARRNRRVNRVFAGGSALMVASYIGRLVLMTTAPWMTFAGWLTSYV